MQPEHLQSVSSESNIYSSFLLIILGFLKGGAARRHLMTHVYVYVYVYVYVVRYVFSQISLFNSSG